MKIDLEHQETASHGRGATSSFTRREIFETRVNSGKAIETGESTDESRNFGDINHSYELLEDFAEGGLGKLNVAKDKVLKRFVAVKSLKDEFKDHPRLPLDFISEAKITAQLDHPSIVPVYSLNTDARDGLYFAMKLINGRTMRECIDEAVLGYKQNGCRTRQEIKACKERLQWFLKVCEAISFAHARGVLHRDLKPENIMIGEFGEVYVMDWGIARLKEEKPVGGGTCTETEKPCSNSTKIDGTPGYLAPELLCGEEFTNQTDLFALGMILFEQVFLKCGVSGDSLKEVLEHLRHGQFEEFSHRFPSCKVPIDLRAIIAKAIHPNPERRYADVALLAADIRFYLSHEEVSARPDNAVRKVVRWTFNHKMQTFSFFMVVMFVAAATTTFSLYRQMKDAQEARRRELVLTTYQGQVADIAHRIDQSFQHMKDMLENLAGQTAFLLQHPAPYPGKIYETSDFNPPDLGFAPNYRRSISLKYPGMIVPPGARGQAEALIPLGDVFFRMWYSSPIGDLPDKRKLLEADLPLKWVYVGLESGLFAAYPGKDGYPADYDPRKRPWYQMGKTLMKTGWGSPYRDISGQGLVLPCVSPIVGNDGTLYGIVGLDVTLEYIIRHIMKNSAPWVKSAYILDGQGRIIVNSADSGRQLDHRLGNDLLKLQTFSRKNVWNHILNHGSGQMREDGTLFAFTRIPTVDWYYVEEAEFADLRY